MSYYGELTSDMSEWKKLIAFTPAEKATSARRQARSTTEFRMNVWEKEVGEGGMFAEYLTHDLTSCLISPPARNGARSRSGTNEKYLPPCAYACPSRIPSHKRATLIRRGRLQRHLSSCSSTARFRQRSADRSARTSACKAAAAAGSTSP